MSFVQDVKLAKDYIGKHISETPVPAFVLDKSKIKENSNRMLNQVEELGNGIRFRVHVETLKCTQVVRHELGDNNQCDSVVVSTLEEIRNLVSLVEEGVVKDVLYGSPLGLSQVKELAYLKNLYANLGATLRLCVDNIEQLDYLLENSSNWSVFIKLEIDEYLENYDPLITTIACDSHYNSKIHLFGFYCHASASCGNNDLSISQNTVQEELDMAIQAANITRQKLEKRRNHLKTIKTTNNNIQDPNNIPFRLSIGATPSSLNLNAKNNNTNTNNNLHQLDQVELHAGSYVALDLRHVGISDTLTKNDIAGTVLTEICSYHASKKQYVINAGVLALSREVGSTLPGIAHIKGVDDWIVTKVYQEHGIIQYVGSEANPKLPFRVGDRIVLYPQNTCITSSCHRLYFIVDGSNSIVDVWRPWRYW